MHPRNAPLPAYLELPLPQPMPNPERDLPNVRVICLENPIEYVHWKGASPGGRLMPRPRRETPVALPAPWHPLLAAAARKPVRLPLEAGMRPGWRTELAGGLAEWAALALAAHAGAGLRVDHRAHLVGTAVCNEPQIQDLSSAHQRMAQALLDGRVVPRLCAIAHLVRTMAGPFWRHGSIRLRVEAGAAQPWDQLPIVPTAFLSVIPAGSPEPPKPSAIVEAFLRPTDPTHDAVFIRAPAERFPDALCAAIAELRRVSAALRGWPLDTGMRPAWRDRLDPGAAGRRRLARALTEQAFGKESAAGHLGVTLRYSATWGDGLQASIWHKTRWPIVPDLTPEKVLPNTLSIVSGFTATGKTTVMGKILSDMDRSGKGRSSILMTTPPLYAARQQAVSRMARNVPALEEPGNPRPAPLPTLPPSHRLAPRGGPWPPAPLRGHRAGIRTDALSHGRRA